MKVRRSFFVLVSLCAGIASAEVLAPPGDLGVRHDLDLLNDSRAINITATAWPISWGEIQTALRSVDRTTLPPAQRAAFERLFRWSREAIEPDLFTAGITASVAEMPRFIRSFENTPRDELELTARASWVGERLTMNLQATVVDDPLDGDEVRPDGTYVGVALGNWMLTAGWQDRWWGPARDGSLILGTNHRPPPGIALQRNNSTPSESRWLAWLGPWSLTTFMQWLDDDRGVEDALLWGIRGSIRPVEGLEIGLSRAAQWCGRDRPCDLETFGNVLLGRDNRGVNVDAEDEPGNQLAGIDIRWSLPNRIPLVAYMQWIGEDGRGGGEGIGSWLRQVGLEFYGGIGDASHRTHVEVADTTCRQGGFGFSDSVPICAYIHPIYSTGYRYRGKNMGHPIDGDGRSFSFGSTLVQSQGHVWNLSLRYMEIKRVGRPEPTHTLSQTPQDVIDMQLSHERLTKLGRFRVGIGYSELEDVPGGTTSRDAMFFVQWGTR